MSAPIPPEQPRFLSEADCHDIAQRLARFATGGGSTAVVIRSDWTGNVRWARNLISSSGEVRTNWITLDRNINGATSGWVLLNDTTDAALVAAARRAERMAAHEAEAPQQDLIPRLPLELMSAPPLFSEATYQMDAERRTAAALALAHSASATGMLSAGYLEVSAHSQAIIDSYGRALFFRWTQAQYSVTVRDPQGTGSGWAGQDWDDWQKIDAAALSAVALDKCLTSRHPVAIEPGRYTTILEPQAVCDFIGQLVFSGALDRNRAWNESEMNSTGAGPFLKRPSSGPGRSARILSVGREGRRRAHHDQQRSDGSDVGAFRRSMCFRGVRVATCFEAWMCIIRPRGSSTAS